MSTVSGPTHGEALVVGASRAGLMTALTLARQGMRVVVLERSDDSGRTGAALSVPDGLLERITGLPPDHPPHALASGVQSWFAVHDALHAAASARVNIELRPDTRVTEVGQDANAAWATTAEGERIRADMLVGADGHRSVTRRHVAPISRTRSTPAKCSGLASRRKPSSALRDGRQASRSNRARDTP